MTFRKGDAVRLALEERPLWFVRQGIAAMPYSRRWVTLEDENSLPVEASARDVYVFGAEWQEWKHVYEETSAESRAEVTCQCCGQIDKNRVQDPEKMKSRAARLREAHNAAELVAGRIPDAR